MRVAPQLRLELDGLKWGFPVRRGAQKRSPFIHRAPQRTCHVARFFGWEGAQSLQWAGGNLTPTTVLRHRSSHGKFPVSSLPRVSRSDANANHQSHLGRFSGRSDARVCSSVTPGPELFDGQAQAFDRRAGWSRAVPSDRRDGARAADVRPTDLIVEVGQHRADRRLARGGAPLRRIRFVGRDVGAFPLPRSALATRACWCAPTPTAAGRSRRVRAGDFQFAYVASVRSRSRRGGSVPGGRPAGATLIVVRVERHSREPQTAARPRDAAAAARVRLRAAWGSPASPAL